MLTASSTPSSRTALPSRRVRLWAPLGSEVAYLGSHPRLHIARPKDTRHRSPTSGAPRGNVSSAPGRRGDESQPPRPPPRGPPRRFTAVLDPVDAGRGFEKCQRGGQSARTARRIAPAPALTLPVRSFPARTPIPHASRRQTALVTGGSRSIGRGIAVGLAREGADVAVGYRSSREDAESAVRQIEATGRRAVAVQGSTDSRPDVGRFVAEAHFLGGLDILVNNAGVLKRTPLLEISEEEWDAILNVNLKGYFLVGQAVARRMVETGRRARSSTCRPPGRRWPPRTSPTTACRRQGSRCSPSRWRWSSRPTGSG